MNKNFRTVAITNRQLFGHVAMMLSLDVIVSVIWILVEPMERLRTLGVSYSDPNDADILIVPVVDSCSSPNMAMFTGVVIAYKSLLIIGGATLAVLTQKVFKKITLNLTINHICILIRLLINKNN